MESEKKRRVFKSRVECNVGFEGYRAKGFRDVVYWLGKLRKAYYYSDYDDVPLVLDWTGVEVLAMDSDRIRMPHVRILPGDIDNFWFDVPKRFRAFSTPARVSLPIKKLLYAFEEVDKQTVLNMFFRLEYGHVKAMPWIKVRKPEVCPSCNRETVYNLLPVDKRGKYGDRYKCICGWRGRVRVKDKRIKTYESTLNTEKSLCTIEVRNNKVKERFELTPLNAKVEVLKIPQIPFNAEVKVIRNQFLKVLKRVKKLTSIASLSLDANGFRIKAKEEGVRSATFQINDEVLLHSKGMAHSDYNIEKLIDAVPPLGEAITIRFSEKVPLLVTAHPEHFIASEIECWQAPIVE